MIKELELGVSMLSTEAQARRTETAMELAAPVYNLAPAVSGHLRQDPMGKDPGAVKQAIEIMRETLDQATHPEHPLHGDGVLVDLYTRLHSFEMRMPEIEAEWLRRWN